MTISLVPEDTRRRRFTCTGGETTFAITFPVFAAADVQVVRLRNGVTTTLSQPADYIVAGAGGPSGFTVTLGSPALAGDVIVVLSAQPVARTSEWTDGQALRATALNAEFARWWIALQQSRRDLDRTIRLSVTDAGTGGELPPASERAGRLLGFDPVTGQPVAVTPNPGNLVISAQGEALIAAATPAEARAVINAASSADVAGRVAKAGDTMTGNLTISKDAPELRLTSPAPSTRIVRFQTGSADRLLIGVSATAESGSNTGSNTFMRRVLDDGTEIDFLVVERNTGRVRIEGSVPLRLPAVDPTDANDAVRKAALDAALATLASGRRLTGVYVFNSTQNWTPPSGTTAMLVYAIGGGGGGGKGFEGQTGGGEGGEGG